MLCWLFFLPVTLVLGLRGPHHPQGHVHYKPKQDGPKLTQDSQLLHDVEHIQDDLNNVISEEYLKKMTPEELEFHYFKIHDFDNNTKLDGLEILQAIRHTFEHLKLGNNLEEQSENKKLNIETDFGYVVEMIDQVLAEDDVDKDGYLSYMEYVIGRQKDQSKKKKFIKNE
ncbi:multiple coagulation factor deficiency protein 2 homolog [Cimex lectularius]|uniref:Multiple coagulation factor deficiency protein 2 homolog n=1 Tax=Cimex lectularius TaxID=79782 RepID=A0A8I6SSW7_CIMLE|nr:multiple coagulation factor deficiency protein 2 homolog [Cimex lectularius]XP_024081956.1 multiple coagulation factor deficiency protein 2 homolog [Cimex lectularius]XP_024081957.1 multiple coagulation factor deficiency protein 2 homolog [Cimex lectularius]